MTNTQEKLYYSFTSWALDNGCDMNLIMPEDDTVMIMQENDGSNDWVKVPEEFEELAMNNA
jgi:uncharacterized protein YgfB (UPF0149 family)